MITPDCQGIVFGLGNAFRNILVWSQHSSAHLVRLFSSHPFCLSHRTRSACPLLVTTDHHSLRTSSYRWSTYSNTASYLDLATTQAIMASSLIDELLSNVERPDNWEQLLANIFPPASPALPEQRATAFDQRYEIAGQSICEGPLSWDLANVFSPQSCSPNNCSPTENASCTSQKIHNSSSHTSDLFS